MTKLLKLQAVVEGVETEEQLHKLYENDCEIVQGFIISKPLPAEELNKKREQIKTNIKRLGKMNTYVMKGS
ncbi:EAL domain-containing protein [Bacillus sp. JCM 19034]|uniref:EAL domain-containing protein n=1 Tax=Bacillus sp. JCM 19034 TaxID=1481928 RepID=UPI000781D1AA|nr:EAL domain-containing protein [Bacillus sp. JCM 19034]